MTSTLEDTAWTSSKLEEELYLDLMKIRSGEMQRKYESQAKDLIHKIPVYRPVPNFVVNLTDLSDRVKVELRGLGPESLNDVMKEGIGTLTSVIFC